MENQTFKRSVCHVLLKRLSEPRRFIQVLSGPRQTGKTTVALQGMAGCKFASHYASADEPTLKDRTWIEQQWETARARLNVPEHGEKAVLILDEVQKVIGWSETVKRLWDEDTSNKLPLHVIVLGSSPLLVQRGLTESLAGRFEIIPVTHWSLAEMEEAFGWAVEQYVFYGGYPGAADLVHDRERWSNYIVHSLIETTVARDILLMTRVDKPALLRRLFELGCAYSGQVLSYQKMLGQLQDAGNTTTLSHYLNLLEGSGLLAGLPKYAGAKIRQRASSPKLQVLNTGLMTAQRALSMEEVRKDTDYWGRLVESAVGATLINGLRGKSAQVFYWLSRSREVDFVLCRGDVLVAIEVKSGRRRASLSGMDAFSKAFEVTRKLLVGAQGIPLREFLLTPPEHWLH